MWRCYPLCRKCFKNIRKDKQKSRTAGNSDKQQTKCTPQKQFRCGFVDHLIAKFPKPPKDNKKRQKKIRFSESGNCALQKECKNGDNDNDQYIYVSMA